MSEVLILDLGYGNTRSIALAFERLGATAVLSADAAGTAFDLGKEPLAVRERAYSRFFRFGRFH